MKKKRILLAAITVFLAAAIACTLYFALREGSKGILYRVTGDNATAYLLGSIHIGTSAMHPFGDELEAAMAASDVFVFECDTDSDDALSELAARQVLPDDTTLSALVGEDLYNDTVAAYQELHLSTASIDTQQPWVIINTLAVYSTASEIGVKNVHKAISLGVEPTVREFATKYGKQYAYLETVNEVADTMESFSDALTRYLLQDEIDVVLGRTAIDNAASVAQWPSWWHNGDAEAFRDYYRQSFDSADSTLYDEYQDKLLTQRNALMATRLDTMLQQGGTYFVTVGLLHLVGEDEGSIPALFQEMGYEVELISQP